VPEDIFEMALYEQFSLPGLDNDGILVSSVRQFAEQTLTALRLEKKAEAEMLREWHQVNLINLTTY
jgi:hypothetical protein